MKIPSLLHPTTLLLASSVVMVSGEEEVKRKSINPGGPKLIMENDWDAISSGQFLMALDQGWDILGLVGDTSNSWARQCSMHALAMLELGGLEGCIPVHKGSDYPLLLTPKLMARYQELQGPLVWQGVFRPQNDTAESQGSDPTGGDPSRLSKAAFVEGFPQKGQLAGFTAASWMVEQVRKYPGEVMIWSGGALTNIAMAVRMDSEFASLTKGLYVMGGFVDTNLLQTSGDLLQADINTDFNFKADPEAAKIALGADFPNITIVSQASNDAFPTQDWLDEVYEVQNPYTEVTYRNADPTLPMWDEITAVAMLEPERSVLNETTFYANIDTSFYSPFYGNMFGYQKALVPPAQDLREVKFVYAMNNTLVKEKVKKALQRGTEGMTCH